MKRRTNMSRRKMVSVNNMASMTSLGFHKIPSGIQFRSSTSLTLHNLMITDPKLAALLAMADLVNNNTTFVSKFYHTFVFNSPTSFRCFLKFVFITIRKLQNQHQKYLAPSHSQVLQVTITFIIINHHCDYHNNHYKA